MRQHFWIRKMPLFFLCLLLGCSWQLTTRPLSSVTSMLPTAQKETMALISSEEPIRMTQTALPKYTSSVEPFTVTSNDLSMRTSQLTVDSEDKECIPRCKNDLPTFTPQPLTHTPLPTLSAEKAKKLVFDLLQNNGNCLLPCIWGFTPGKVDLLTLDKFIAQFGELKTPDVYVSAYNYDDGGLFTLAYRQNNIHLTLRFSYYKDRENSKLNILTFHGYSMLERGKDLDWLSPDVSPLYGDISFNLAFQYYMLPQMLSTYGPPSQVLLAPFPDEPGRPDIHWYPFSLVILYPERGIFVEYVSPRETVGDDYVGCPVKSHLSVAVWSPENHLPMEYIVQKGGIQINELNMDYFRPIEEATSMTLEEFYQTFKISGNSHCLQTPIRIWPTQEQFQSKSN